MNTGCILSMEKTYNTTISKTILLKSSTKTNKTTVCRAGKANIQPDISTSYLLLSITFVMDSQSGLLLLVGSPKYTRPYLLPFSRTKFREKLGMWVF